jgi:glycosyltransferase involved in cell wall biosynthesis/cytochrome c-type biogenesis protein CcmH/NrfG/ubiquinone/menaquinone biosynthesis C-methylase UbiE
MIIHPEGNINNNPNLTGIVEILCEQGFAVDIYSPRNPSIPQSSPCAGARLILSDLAERLHFCALFPQSVLEDAGNLIAFVDEKVPRYDLIIGVDQGIIEAGIIASLKKVPHALISYEILFTEEAGAERKKLDVQFARDVQFAVCQDRVRSYHLSQEYGIPLDRIIDVPVAGRQAKGSGRNFILHDALGLGRDKKIALYMGSVTSNWSGVNELLETTGNWDDNWVLVLHHRYSQPDSSLVARIRNLGKKNVFLSPFNALPFDDLHKVIQSADLGVVFYIPQMDGTDIYCRNNLKYIGMASGKTSTYLQCGLPVLINRIGEMSDHVVEKRLGAVSDSFSDIPGILSSLTSDDLSSFRGNCIDFFSSRLDLDATIKPLLNVINGIVGEQNAIADAVGGKCRPQTAVPALALPSPPPNRRDDVPDGADLTPTPGTFDFFTYSRKEHFPLFRQHAQLLFGREFDENLSDLKAYQDLLVYSFITANIPKGARILEIGGGCTRVLKAIAKDYECWNLDKCEGVGNGPLNVTPEGYRLIRDYIGTFSRELPDGYFDLVFSISVLEHIPEDDETFEGIYNDINRVLKPDGLSLHCVDLVKRCDHLWTNQIIHHLASKPSLLAPLPDFAAIMNDPGTYVMSQKAYDATWKVHTKVEYESFGMPLSCNILWSNRRVTETVKSKSSVTFLTKSTPPRISIVTPSYNQAEFLEECIDSVLGQNYPNLEYIVMDGGSSDGSTEIIRRYERHLTYWQSRPDGGHYNAVSAGFARSTGEIMAWLNSDDKYHPGAFAKVACLMMDHPEVEWLTGRRNVWGVKGNLFNTDNYLMPLSRRKYLEGHFDKPFVQQESTFWRRSLWERAGGTLSTELKLAGDMELWTRFFRYAQLYSIDTFLGGFRYHDDQRSAVLRESYMKESREVVNRERLLFSAEPAELMPMPPQLQLNMERFSSFLREHGITSQELGNYSCWTRYRDDLSLLVDSIARSGRLEMITFVGQEADRIDLLAREGSFGAEKREVIGQIKNALCYADELNRRGEESYLAGDDANARKDFNEAIRLYPGFSTAYNNLGIISYKNGDMVAALDCMNKALVINPFNREVLLNIREMPELPGYKDYAENRCDYYLELNPDDLEIAKLRSKPSFGTELADNSDGRFTIQKGTGDMSAQKGDDMQTSLLNNSEDIRVTAIVSSYNAEQFMRECLTDLVNQSIAGQMEVIVVDAASPEAEGSIVADFQRRHKNITYIRTGTRIGVYAAWNMAIRHARGRYITPFSTNDRLRSDAYEIMADTLDRHRDVMLVYGDSYKTANPHETFDSHTCCGTFQWPDYSYEDLLRTCLIGPHPMWRKSVHETVGFFDESYLALGDQDFFIRVGAGFKMLHIPQYTGLYWLSESGLSNKEELYLPEIQRIRKRYSRKSAMGAQAVPSQRKGATPGETLSPEDRDALKSLALAKKEEREYGEAFDLLSKVRSSGDMSVLADLGDCLANQGKIDEAAGYYREAILHDCDNTKAHIGVGVQKLMSGNFPEAAVSFTRALRREPDNANALCGLGMARNGQGHKNAGYGYFLKALKADPENLSALNELFRAAYESGKFADAVTHTRNYLKYHPANLDILFSFAGLLYKSGAYEEALDAMERLMALSPDYQGGKELMESISAASYRDTPLKVTIGASRSTGDSVASLIEEGRLHKAAARYGEAFDSFCKARDMGDATVLADMGDCKAYLGSMDEAGAYYEEGVRNDPLDARALVGSGVVSLFQEKLKDADICFAGALRAEPENTKALCGLAMVRNMQGKESEAYLLLNQALEREPENLTALYELVKCAYRIKRYDGAERHLRSYLRFHPADLKMIFSLAGVLFRMNRGSEALEQLDTILLFDPAFEGAWEMRQLIGNELQAAV